MDRFKEKQRRYRRVRGNIQILISRARERMREIQVDDDKMYGGQSSDWNEIVVAYEECIERIAEDLRVNEDLVAHMTNSMERAVSKNKVEEASAGFCPLMNRIIKEMLTTRRQFHELIHIAQQYSEDLVFEENE